MSDNETIKLRVRMRDGDEIVRGVLCELPLPERADGPIELRLSSQTDRLGYPFEFSILGRIRGGNDHMTREVRAEHVYWKNGGGTTYWGPRLAAHVILGDPIDLTITDTHPRAGRARSGRAHITFWLTPNVLLRPSKFRKTSYTGSVTIKARRTRHFTINGVSLAFDRYYRYRPQDDGSSVTFSEPVAAGTVRRLADVPRLLEPLEDFLLLAAVAARQRTICVGWEAVHPPVYVRHYRRGISIPQEKKNHGIGDVLTERSRPRPSKSCCAKQCSAWCMGTATAWILPVRSFASTAPSRRLSFGSFDCEVESTFCRRRGGVGRRK